MANHTPLIGLDLGSSAIKAVELDCSGERPFLKHIAIRERAFADVTGIDAILPELLPSSFLPHDRVAMFPLPEEPEIDFLKLPELPAAEMASSVRWEIAQLRNIPADDIVLDYHVVKNIVPPDSMQGMQKRIMAVHASRDAIQASVAQCQKAKLHLAALDARELALAATLLANYEFSDEEPAIAIDIGGRTACLVVLVGGEVRFTRRLNVSGLDLHTTLKESFSLEDSEVMPLIRDCEIVPQSDANLANRTVLSLAADVFAEKMLTEIRLATDFCLLNLAEDETVGNLRRIFLAGGIANLKGIDAYLQEQMNIDVEILDPLRKIDFDFAVLDDLGMEQVPQMAVAIGLALRNREDDNEAC